MKCFLIIILTLNITGAFGQAQDTLQELQLKSYTVRAYRQTYKPMEALPTISGTYQFAGKRSEVISMDAKAASLPDKSVRQIFAKIPGAFAYDMDGSGNQINMALRGLDPHRSWDLNVRQNHVILNSDLYGYPASHYAPPLESIERIELVRGTASLQYGAMFGGMLNYVTRQPDTSKAISFENQSSIGSFGQLSTFNRLGGRSGRFTWQTYYYRRAVDGYRNDSRSASEAQFASLQWQLSDRIQIKGEIARSTYRYQIPGPLSDSMAMDNPNQSTRQRNYYSPDILIPSLTFNWELDARTQIEWITSHLTGDRSSVQFLGAVDRLDTIDSATGRYKPRQVDIDLFNSTTSELRLRRNYTLGRKSLVLVSGIRYIHNDLHRRQIGKGTDGTDYDLTLTDPLWGRDLRYQTNNLAFFIENAFWITPKLSIAPGFRLEQGLTLMRGEIRSLPPDRAVADIKHRFALFGCNVEYQPTSNLKIYGGIAQAYRPVVLGEIIPANILERVDTDLRDSRGYNAEIGVSGNFLYNHLTLNASLFRLQYNDRIGNQAFEDGQGNTYFLKKNIGDSRTDGVELYAELTPVKTDITYLSIFTATAWMSGKYLNGELASGTENISIKGNQLESVPNWTSRNGIQFSWKRWSASVQYSFVDKTFSDPLNTPVPVPNGTRGPVPAYGLWDAQMGVQITPEVKISIAGNNLANLTYFTKRPSIYPGPGVWPSDGRSVVATLVVRL